METMTMTTERKVIGLDFFPPLNTLTVCWTNDAGKVDFAIEPAPEPRSGVKIKALGNLVHELLFPHDAGLVVVGQSYAGIGADDAHDAIVEACEPHQHLLVRHNKIVTHFTGLHMMSRNTFVMDFMRKSAGSRFGEIYSDMLRRYGVDMTKAAKAS